MQWKVTYIIFSFKEIKFYLFEYVLLAGYAIFYEVLTWLIIYIHMGFKCEVGLGGRWGWS